MHAYIINTKYSVEILINLIFDEIHSLDTFKSELSAKESQFQHYQKEFEFKDFNDDFCDLQVQDAFIKMAESKKGVDILKSQIHVLSISIQNKDFSIRALCGALLQIAKQGISFVHGKYKHLAPNGHKTFGAETLKNVIWEGRNQTLHFEEGIFQQPIIDCFKNLEIAYGSDFLLSKPPKNKSLEIIRLLDWTTYKNYEKDMVSILG
ncbi:hypothetical protein SJPD1_2720 [Sulfurospirillum diekertiae]|uniref:Uncharacterized protein n=1 Tax=Sulfurospirillum diekertiae TaxID=1854492 RepID=A0A290HZM6_9BACT|nr:hypothetical protein [Sulfurospirillum diekertiae]ATB70809.1 hypothetical protein SJPD1_2720 [Sulfurospirillum diekertiae]